MRALGISHDHIYGRLRGTNSEADAALEQSRIVASPALIIDSCVQAFARVSTPGASCQTHGLRQSPHPHLQHPARDQVHRQEGQAPLHGQKGSATTHAVQTSARVLELISHKLTHSGFIHLHSGLLSIAPCVHLAALVLTPLLASVVGAARNSSNRPQSNSRPWRMMSWHAGSCSQSPGRGLGGRVRLR